MPTNYPALFTQTITAGDRAYTFAVHQSPDGAPYLVITEAKLTALEYEHHHIGIPAAHLDAFTAGLESALAFLHADHPPKAYTVADIRQHHPKAYTPWTPAEDAALTQNYRAGTTLPDLVRLLQRQPGAIRSRLHKLGLK